MDITTQVNRPFGAHSVLLSMSPQVTFQVCTLKESSAADITLVRPLSRVASHVLPQMAAVGETFMTVRAAEGLLTRVNPHVDFQISFPAALLPTHVAAVQFYPRVAGHVVSQSSDAIAASTAHVTKAGALVRHDVLAKTVRGLKDFPAHSAGNTSLIWGFIANMIS